MKKKKSGRTSTIILVIIFLAGMFLLLYPSVANYVNSLHSSRAIKSYSEEVAVLDTEEYDRLWSSAEKYNTELTAHGPRYMQKKQYPDNYTNQLRIQDNGVMGQIEISAIGVSLPIFHGTSNAVLQQAIGHLDWTSLPIGGESTHCVLSGHRGLPSAKLFTHLDQLVVGDTFVLRVLDEVLTYEVDQILIVLPEETEPLGIVEGEDYCTLLTCTPYGINTHRLLVRGHRIDNEEHAATIHITAEAIQIDPMIVSSAMGIPALLILFFITFLSSSKKSKKKN